MEKRWSPEDFSDISNELDGEIKNFQKDADSLKPWLESSKDDILGDDEFFVHANNAVDSLKERLKKIASLKRELNKG